MPDLDRIEIEGEFQEIDGKAHEKGSKAIIDEAVFHGEDLALQFSALTGFHEHAFWTFLNRKYFWNGALTFHHAVSIAEFWKCVERAMAGFAERKPWLAERGGDLIGL